MPFGLPSEIASIAFLSLLFFAAFIVAAARRPGAEQAQSVVAPASLALALQALHVGEEFSAGFHLRAPALFSLEAWSPTFFVSINLVAISAWSLALVAFARRRPNLFASGLLWFLAIASIGNSLWHPAVSLALGRYFPGLVTAVPLGIAGLFLARALLAPEGRGKDGS